MTCSLLVALRRCGRGRWHDGGRGEKGWIEGTEGKDSRDLASTQEQQQRQSKVAQSNKNNLEKLFWWSTKPTTT